MRAFTHTVKERYLKPNDTLFLDATPAEFLYFTITGELKIEKQVDL